MQEVEDQLTAAAIEGDEQALTQLLHRYDSELRGRLTGKIDRIYSALLDVDDVLQITYMEAFLRIGQYAAEQSGNFLAWLTRIAENNLIDAIRFLNRGKRPPPGQQAHATGSEDTYVALIGNLIGPGISPSRAASGAELRVLLDQALDELPADYAKTIRLYDLESNPIAAVAQAMGRSEGAVHMLRMRGHDRLREVLRVDGKSFSDLV